MKQPIRCLVLAVIASAPLMVFSSAHAQVTTIYADPLTGAAPADGGGYQSLGGAQPATDTGGAYWSAQYYAAPSATVSGLDDYRYTNSQAFATQLPLTVDNLGTYTLTVDVNYPSGSYNNLDFGFVNSSQGNNYDISTADAAADMVVLGYQGALDTHFGYATGSASTTYTQNTSQALSISLDSTTGTLVFSLNGTPFDTETNALTPTQMSGITAIALGGYYAPADAYFTNFSLTESIATAPEPGTWALLAGGLAFLLLLRSRRSLRN